MKKLALVIVVLFVVLAPAQWYNYPQPMRFDGESVIFQPPLDQTDFLQVLDADGGTAILNVDTTNEQVEIPQQVLVGGATSTSVPWDTSSNLVRHFKMNDNAADKVVEDATGTLDGVYEGANTNQRDAAGKINNSLYFDGNNDSVSIEPVGVTGQTMTIAMWVKGPASVPALVYLYDDGQKRIFWDVTGAGAGTLGYYDVSSKNSSGISTPSDADWHHLVWVFDATAGTAILYFDGQSGVSMSYGGTSVATPASLAASSSGASAELDGYLDDVRIYERALTQYDAEALWNEGAGTETSTTGTTVTTFQAIATTSSYISSHNLDSLADLAIEGELEVNGASFFDDDVTIADGKSIGQSAGPLLTFDDTDNYLEFTGANLGIGETAPETLTEWTGTAPYLTLHNSTHEDTDGGGESRIIFKREDSAGTETALGQLEGSHYGSGATDQLGKLVASVNSGAGLASVLTLAHDSVIIQQPTDSTTGVQIMDADGGTPVLNVDTTNERVGIGTSGSGTDFVVKPKVSGGGITVREADDGNDAVQLIGYNSAGIIRCLVNNSITVQLNTSGDSYFTGGNLGIGEGAPETLIEMTSATLYLTLHNSTHEDSDGGRESRWIAKGEQSGGEETTLGYEEWSHDGASDDQKGQKRIYVNGGSDGDSPTLRTTWDSAGNLQHGDGGTTNYTQWDVNGVQTMAGNARVTKHIYIPISGGAGANNPTVRTTEAPYLSWTFAVNDDDHHTLPAPHDMDYTQPINIYVEWYTTDATASGVDEVNWQIQWASRAAGETVNAGSTTDTSGDVICSAQYVIVDTLVETIPGNSVTADDIMGMDLTRIAIVDGTAPSVGTVHVLSWHVEFTSNKLGEAL